MTWLPAFLLINFFDTMTTHIMMKRWPEAFVEINPVTGFFIKHNLLWPKTFVVWLLFIAMSMYVKETAFWLPIWTLIDSLVVISNINELESNGNGWAGRLFERTPDNKITLTTKVTRIGSKDGNHLYLWFWGFMLTIEGFYIGAEPDKCPECNGKLKMHGYGEYGGHKLTCYACNWWIQGVREERKCWL